jgi:pimeloyl-ACP methyl ester carboxylesterase
LPKRIVRCHRHRRGALPPSSTTRSFISACATVKLDWQTLGLRFVIVLACCRVFHSRRRPAVRSLYINDLWQYATVRGMGSPVLLVHGFPLDHRMWLDQIEVLSTRHRVIAPDLRGFGQSVGARGTTTMAQFADDLLGFLDQLEVVEPVNVCALSMGGYIAWEFWRRHAVRVRTLILCDTRAAADTEEAARNRRLQADRISATGVGDLADQMLPKLLAPSTIDGQLQIVDRIRAMVAAADPSGVAAALRGMAERSDSTTLLSEINVPSLVIVGEHDAIAKADEMRGLAAAMPNAEFKLIPGAGHMAPMEDPSAVNDALLAFLSR